MDYGKINEEIKKMVSDKRYLHSLGVVETAMKLAVLYGCDQEKTMYAAISHDCAKSLDREVMLEIAGENGLVFDEITLYETQLMHGPIGRLIARKEFGIEDEEILSAIEFHTTGKADMTLLEKIIYLSDFIEPTRDYKGVRKLRKLALENLDQALAMAFDNTIRYVISIESVLHPRTIEARNYLLMNNEGGKL